MRSKKIAPEQTMLGTTDLRLRLEINNFTGLVAHTFSFSINTGYYIIYTAPLPLPPLIVASDFLLLLLIPLIIVPSQLLLSLRLNWIRAIELNHQAAHWILNCCRQHFKLLQDQAISM